MYNYCSHPLLLLIPAVYFNPLVIKSICSRKALLWVYCDHLGDHVFGIGCDTPPSCVHYMYNIAYVYEYYIICV